MITRRRRHNMGNTTPIFLLTLLGFFFHATPGWCTPCSPRKFDQDSVVCVCNQTYCDTFDEIQPVQLGQALVYETSKDGKRLESNTLMFGSKNKRYAQKYGFRPFYVPKIIISINASKQYQEIIGFGGAFTDAVGINMLTLPQNMQDTLINDYFSSKGLEYNIGRIPMASSDFSTHQYSYADVENDFQLEHFKLTEEDFKLKIPFVNKAKSVSKTPIFFFGSPWSSPYWMKTGNNMTGKGTLKGEVGGQYYQTWANYFVKFLQSYQTQNISFWGLTVENEPGNGYDDNIPFQSLGFTAETQRDFITENLGPALEKAGYGTDRVKLMTLDDQRTFLPDWADTVFENKLANKYVSGVAFHWYLNSIAPASKLDIVHQNHPEKFLFASEACTGSNPWEVPKVALGNWGRGEEYAHDIMEDLNHWTGAWVDWNLALDLGGGPNWVSNFVDSPIIIDAIKMEYYKQPMFYALGHFSKFIPRNSVRVDATTVKDSLFLDQSVEFVAFKRPDGAYVLVTLNRNAYPVELVINDPRLGSLSNELAANSIQTFIWWRR